ncbi:MAG: hypothetical protein AB1832_09385 [Pseudomonadota bacterium]
MMRPMLRQALALGGILATGVAMASGASHSTNDAGRARVAEVHRAVARDAAEVARLQRSVAEQEARSREASLRLREQDQALERLRQELQAAGGSDETVATGP